MRWVAFRCAVLGLCFAATFAAAAQGREPATAGTSKVFAQLVFRSIGPNPGRLDAVAGVPGDPRVYYVGGLGGLFKSDNGGASFAPIFNEPDVSSIGAIAVAPSDPNVVYVGTGEPNLRNDIEPGDGVWRSGDAGRTWQHIGLEETAHIAQIAIDPHDRDVAYVAAIGRVYGNGPERGVFKTTDGGKTWQHVLAFEDRTGGSSVVIDPADTSTVFAGAWTVWRTPWMLNSGGPNDGLYVSHDAGAHWTRIEGHGFPSGLTGRIGLAFAPSNPRRIYALVESKSGVLWRSDDGGATWRLISKNHLLAQRPFYFSELTVDPTDENHVFFMSIDLMESHDGGKTAKALRHFLGDDHQMWIDPLEPWRSIVVSDDGAKISLDGAKTWAYPQIPISQAYHVDTDDGLPYTVCAELQDEGSACGPSDSKVGGIIPSRWFSAAGGESGWILFDPADPNLIYGSGYGGALTRFDRRTNQAISIAPYPLDVLGWAARDERYRFQWTAPIAVSKLEPRALYFGGNVLFKSDDEGLHWHIISPDLTRNDKSKQLPTGGPITHDSTSVETYDTIFTIAESPMRRSELWVGTDDGLVWLTTDGGRHWRNVTAAIPGMPAWARVTSLVASPFDSATAYLAVDAHLLGDRRPYLYVTHDFGIRWRRISGNLTGSSYALVLKPDPLRRGLLYLGTALGLYVTFDDGRHWQRLQNGLPTVPVYDLTVQKRFDDLVVATHGRGIYILDDIHALQGYAPKLATEPLTLFRARTAYEWSTGRSTYYSFYTQHGTDPKRGAFVDFWLRAPPVTGERVVVRIYDGKQLVRTIPVPHPQAGINRIVWDMRYPNIPPVKGYEPERDAGFRGPLVVPGAYRVVVTAGTSSRSGLVRIASDPRAGASVAALRERFALLMRIRGDLERITSAIGALRVAKASAASERALRIGAVMSALYQPKAITPDDILRYPVRIYGQLSSLAGDVSRADAAPSTAQEQMEVHLEAQLRALLAESKGLTR